MLLPTWPKDERSRESQQSSHWGKRLFRFWRALLIPPIAFPQRVRSLSIAYCAVHWRSTERNRTVWFTSEGCINPFFPTPSFSSPSLSLLSHGHLFTYFCGCRDKIHYISVGLVQILSRIGQCGTLDTLLWLELLFMGVLCCMSLCPFATFVFTSFNKFFDLLGTDRSAWGRENKANECTTIA